MDFREAGHERQPETRHHQQDRREQPKLPGQRRTDHRDRHERDDLPQPIHAVKLKLSDSGPPRLGELVQ
ncbi:hypothetical protein Prum_064130 [Phytohabitans rumicis]|uniref:Uncharacterized protein n=1 Tax=Phytohabitans rumicis TaxID=1076125 RepID=A0A6V8LDC2_9ACTN|nr:hypothetical protein Prum_064130 [Phytohabitans rumicis]